MPMLTSPLLLTDKTPLIYRTDLEGILKFHNEAFSNSTGYDAVELLGKPVSLLRHPDMPDAVLADLWQSLNQGRPWMGILRNRRKDGSDLWVDLYIMRVFEGDLHVGYGAMALELSALQENTLTRRYRTLDNGLIRQRRLAEIALTWLGTNTVAASTLWLASANATQMSLSALALTSVYGIHLLGQRRHLRTLLNDSPNAFATPLSAFLYTGHTSAAAQTSLALSSVFKRLDTALLRMSIAGDQVEQRAKEAAQLVATEAEHLDSQRAETQQAAAAISQMSSTIQQVALHVQSTAKAASTADSEAAQGYQLSSSNLQAMQELSDSVDLIASTISTLADSSSAIVSVVEVINGIAEQTNLLALNAAIEAARAGDAGRGFAVVADEVRALSLRTRRSTGQIESLISKLRDNTQSAVQSAERVRRVTAACVEDVQEVGLKLSGISASVSDICAMSQQMATAVEQQSYVIEDINQQVAHIEQLSARSAGNAQQAALNSQQLSEQAESMQRLARGFNQ